ncbi:probable RNA helicase SDE3 [Selaginella moellendorffii]|uniref:probable RNA helicase SDE3 n=1 Tax=Selaginella moellendorffii TaxID=88036 RepID=UPI000D1C2F47|nr:probable RNA helicase SDE3 [Selaginella moellendorffii]|eukprot:XP_002992741.2 probable RNA helicase SDE3 [Selaginella moellendorffii]
MGKAKLAVAPAGESGIFITQPFPCDDNGEPKSVMVGHSSSANFAVINGSDDGVVLRAVRIAASGTLRGFRGLALTGSEEIASSSSSSRSLDFVRSIRLQPESHVSFTITFSPGQVGYYPARILCDLQPAWRVVQHIQATGDDEVSKDSRPTAPYCKPKPKKMPRSRNIVPGVSPPAPKFELVLPPFWMPAGVRRDFQKKIPPRVFNDGLSPATYARYFAALLYAEEYQMEFDIRAYDMENVVMRQDSGFLILKVLGLAERRPSVLYRDRIYLMPPGTQDKEYEGYVHRVSAEEVFLKFANDFHRVFIQGTRFDVRFSFSRTNLKRCHHAVASISPQLCNMFVFPSPKISPPPPPPPPLRFRPISHGSLNEEQMSAVQEIVAKRGAPPYIIFGPPGTGKTVTVVEAILQVRRHNKDGVILACAPSNNASDLLLERLAKFVENRHMLRLNAFTRSRAGIPNKVKEFSNGDGSPFFNCPSREELTSFKIIVTTCMSAGMLHSRGVPAGHFSHIFLDESGQPTEPEAMVAAINFAAPSTVLVLAGDHQQLGPVIRSPLADKFGLSKSFLERLISSPPYTPPFKKEMVTKLVRNYRSHPSILDLPSRLFYQGELVPCAGEFSRSLCEWGWLPNKKFPILFIGVEGKDLREGNSPSWFNAAEVSKVMEVVKSLRDMRRNKPLATEIGIITPYRKQVEKIKGPLSKERLAEIKVGSVEEFQGQEKRAIIVSTVRSSLEFLGHDKKFNLGFLFNPKRFNVAITRPQALLVVVGNPGILSKNEHWNEFLRYCIRNGSYTGCPIPSPDAAGNIPDYLETSDDEAKDQPWREAV